MENTQSFQKNIIKAIPIHIFKALEFQQQQITQINQIFKEFITQMNQFLSYILLMLFWGFLCNLPLLLLILRKKYLTFPGGVAIGGLIGLIMFIISPVLWIGLVFFFLSSSLISKWKFDQKKNVADDFSKGSRRDAFQVLSNSIPSVFFGIIYLITNFLLVTTEPGDFQTFLLSPWLFAAFASLATHTSDTWMTEVGITSTKQPRSIINLRIKVHKGTSGGITIIGTIAGLAGSLAISLIFAGGMLIISHSSSIHIIMNCIILMFAGFSGALIDSLEGALIQGIYYCNNCQKETEKKIHKCGQKTQFLKGYTCISNDLVNLSSAFIGGWIAFITYILVELVI